MPLDSEFLTANELADRWRVSVSSVMRWRREGKDPPFYKINGTVLYKVADVEQHEKAKRKPSN